MRLRTPAVFYRLVPQCTWVSRLHSTPFYIVWPRGVGRQRLLASLHSYYGMYCLSVGFFLKCNNNTAAIIRKCKKKKNTHKQNTHAHPVCSLIYTVLLCIWQYYKLVFVQGMPSVKPLAYSYDKTKSKRFIPITQNWSFVITRFNLLFICNY